MKMTPAPKLSGVWVSPKRHTVNDWQVALLPDGEMTVSGPGVRGHGHYKAKDDTVVGEFEELNGEPPDEAEEREVRFRLDPETEELTFQTGEVADDAPVRLVRPEEQSTVGDDQSP